MEMEVAMNTFQIGKYDKEIIIQLSFSNRELVSNLFLMWAYYHDVDPCEKRIETITRPASGVQVLEDTRNVFVSPWGFLLRLLEIYQFSGVSYKERRNADGRSYYALKFIFIRKDLAHPPTQLFQKWSQSFLEDLETLLVEAFWKVRGWRNPLEGEFTNVSLNLEGRTSRVGRNGEKVREWRKDAEGKRIGLAPEPLLPDKILVLDRENQTVQLVLPKLDPVISIV